MAKLVLTAAEKAAASYLDWDDAALGKMAKCLALKLDDIANDAEGFRKVAALSCAMMLVAAAHDSNADKLSFDLTGHSTKGVLTGDWRVTIKQIRAPG